MTPQFWQYLITHGDGSEIRLVARNERKAAEEELEGTPGLLSYRAEPQIAFPIRLRPAKRLFHQLRRVRTQKREQEVNHVHDTVVTINNTHWPAYRRSKDMLVDLRLFDPTDPSSKPRLTFWPEELRQLGIPEKLIEEAAQSEPHGLVIFEDLPEGCSGPQRLSYP